MSLVESSLGRIGGIVWRGMLQCGSIIQLCAPRYDVMQSDMRVTLN